MFDKVVFAGGGHRCWWQAGFWEVLRAEIELRPRVIGQEMEGDADQQRVEELRAASFVSEHYGGPNIFP